MAGRPRAPRRHRDEQGATLVLALVLVLVLGLAAVSLLSFAGTSLNAAGVYVEQGRRAYGADGATQLAIADFSRGNPCADYAAPPVNGRRMTVHCDPLNAFAAARVTRPQDALLGLGRGPEDGIAVTTPGLRVQGSVFSHADITAGAGASMLVTGDVSAVGSCSAAVTRTPLPPNQPPYAHSCADDTPPAPADPAVGADPDLVPPATAVPVRRTVPGCPGTGGWLVRLQPGYYDDAPALSRLTGGECPGAVVWLEPGLYHFDFTFTGGPGTWTVTDPTVSVVGGTPTGWDPGAAARPAVPAPGGCDRSRPEGVEVSMGGGSRFQVDRGQVELCAPAAPGAQQVAVYGVQPPKASHVLRPTAVLDGAGFADPAQALTAGERPVPPGCPRTSGTEGCTADAVLAPEHRAASLRLGGFTPQVPPGSVVTGVTLHVRHAETGDLTAPGALTVSAAVGQDTCRTVTPPRHAELATDPPVDLLGACGLTDPSRFAGLTVTHAAALDADGTGATARLDGIWLEVAYRTPITAKPTVVAASAGFGTAGPGDVLEIGEQPAPLVARAAPGPAAPSASVTLTGFGLPPLPSGSTVRSAVLRVAHQETGGVAAPTITVASGGGGCTALPLPARAELRDDRVDLTACGLTDPERLAGLTATYTAGAAGGPAGTASLDGIWLEVVHDPPAPLPATTARSTGFASPADATVIDGTATARAALGPATPTAAIELGGFDTAAVAPGSVLDGALLRLAHREDPGAPGGAPPTVAVTVTGPGLPGPCAPQVLATRQGALGTDTVDLAAACGLTDPARLAGLTVTHTAAVAPGSAGATAQLDGVALELAWRPPLRVRPGTAVGAAFAEPGNARAIDTTGVSTTTLGPAVPSASIGLGGFTTAPLPPGAVIDRVLLRVSHQEDDAGAPAPPAPAAPPTAALTVTGTGTACDAGHALTARQGALGVDVLDLGACGVRTDGQLSGLAVEFTAALGAGSTGATARLDGVELDLVYRAPSVRPLSGCLTEGTRCAVLKSTAEADTATEHSRLLVNGTVYAPTAAVDLSMRQVSSQVVSRGIVARAVRLGIAPAAGYQRPVIGVPPEPVRFTTYPTVSAGPTSVTSGEGFAEPAPGAPVDVADAAVPGGGRATLTLGGYAPAGTGPLDHVALRVTHREDGEVTAVKVAVDFPGSTCADAEHAPALPVRPGPDGPVTDRIDLAPCGLTEASQLAGLTVRYTVTAGAGGASAHLGGTRIDLLSGPLLRADVSFDGHAATVKQWRVLS